MNRKTENEKKNMWSSKCIKNNGFEREISIVLYVESPLVMNGGNVR